MSSNILQYTQIKDIAPTVQKLRKSFHTRELDPIENRIYELGKLYDAINENSELLIAALQKDFHRARLETTVCEISPLLAEIRHIINNLGKWARPSSPASVPFVPFALTGKKIERIPLGTVLVISAYNYPVLLSISPIAGAIAGGNNVVFKPSELTPNLAQALTEVLPRYLSPTVLKIVNGGVEETTELLAQKFDKIMYTGSGRVGKIISVAAAKHLTPVVLELGGKSPAVISSSLSEKQLKITARRIAWGKFSNAGQVCVATDYLLVDAKIYDKFVQLLKTVIEEEFFPNLTAESDYSHIATETAYNRLVKLLSSTKGELVTGGVTDSSARFISPTVYQNVSWDDLLMEDEIFGPLLPVVKFDNLDKEIENIIEYHDTPLAAYIYSNDKKEINNFFKRVRSGSAFVNDATIQCVSLTTPFGGVGQSGQGGYHGLSSFKTFTHERPVFKQAFWSEPLFEGRYPPYTSINETLLTATFLPFGKNRDYDKYLKAAGYAVLAGLATTAYKSVKARLDSYYGN